MTSTTFVDLWIVDRLCNMVCYARKLAVALTRKFCETFCVELHKTCRLQIREIKDARNFLGTILTTKNLLCHVPDFLQILKKVFFLTKIFLTSPKYYVKLHIRTYE